jgi:hypothetical protein
MTTSITGGRKRLLITRRKLGQVLIGVGAIGAGSSTLLRHAFAETPKRGGRLRIATADSAASDTIDPHTLKSFTDIVRKAIIYEKLITTARRSRAWRFRGTATPMRRNGRSSCARMCSSTTARP